MSNTFSPRDRKAIGLITIASGILAAVCLWLGLEATSYNFEAFADPSLLLNMPDVDLSTVRWFMLTDTLGYYLMLLPFLFYIHRQMEPFTPWAMFITSCGFIYIIVGAIGAAILSVTWPSLINAHASATPEMQGFLRADFQLVTNIVYKGMWNNLEVLLGGIWWTAIGFIAFDSNRAAKIITLMLGFSALMDAAGEWFEVPLVAEIGLNLYLVLGIIWPIFIGFILLRKK